MALLACAAFPWGSESARALTRVELYQVTVPVADRSEAAQAVAFDAALKVVLVRVTGRRAAAEDPALAPLTHNARRYVQQYRSASDSELWVAFDGGAIERWLIQNGQPVWGRARPLTLVWLTAGNGPASGVVATADASSDLKSAVSAAAALRGIPLAWPSGADLQREHLDYAAVAAANPGTLAEAGHRMGAEGVLIGRAASVTAGAPVRWTFVFEEHSSDSSGDAAEGVNRAADAYAGIFAQSGGPQTVRIEVSGVKDLHDYARVQAYLESLPAVTHVGVDALALDMVRFSLTARGGADAVRHALGLENKLQPAAAAPAGSPPAEDGTLRYQLRR